MALKIVKCQRNYLFFFNDWCKEVFFAPSVAGDEIQKFYKIDPFFEHIN